MHVINKKPMAKVLVYLLGVTSYLLMRVGAAFGLLYTCLSQMLNRGGSDQ